MSSGVFSLRVASSRMSVILFVQLLFIQFMFTVLNLIVSVCIL